MSKENLTNINFKNNEEEFNMKTYVENLISSKLRDLDIEIPFWFKDYDDSTVAEITNDKSMLFISTVLYEDGFAEFIKEEKGYSLEAFVDSVIAHELGHYADPSLESRGLDIANAYKKYGISSLYLNLYLSAEEVAYELGKQFSNYPEVYDKINLGNLRNIRKALNKYEEVA